MAVARINQADLAARMRRDGRTETASLVASLDANQFQNAVADVIWRYSSELASLSFREKPEDC